MARLDVEIYTLKMGKKGDVSLPFSNTLSTQFRKEKTALGLLARL